MKSLSRCRSLKISKIIILRDIFGVLKISKGQTVITNSMISFRKSRKRGNRRASSLIFKKQANIKKP
jgi:hypothetical protein